MSKELKQLNVKQIQAILPHRYPFLLVDRVTHLDLNTNEIIGLKNVSMNEPFFQGHFPGLPLMPGVLILEAIAQTGGILVHENGYVGKIAVLSNVKSAKFRQPVVPGDTLMIHVKALHISLHGGKIEAKVMVGEKLVAEAELSFVMRVINTF
jgi:3-hydroxyacyl-[acyl-carrier-protein] dehydratase